MTKTIIKYSTIVAFWLPLIASATSMADFSFKSPSLNGSGYGTYQMTLENEQYQRQLAVQQ